MSIELAFPAGGTGRGDVLPPPFACSCTNGGLDAARVHVGGELDIATAPLLERTLSRSQARLVVLDLRELAFIDTSGVHAIINAGIRARKGGRRLLLVHVPSHVDRMLTLTGTAIRSRSATSTRSRRPSMRSSVHSSRGVCSWPTRRPALASLSTEEDPAS
jgi:anti-anti-sigma factor